MARPKAAAAAAVAFTGAPAAELVDIALIDPSPTNPRKTFDTTELQELVDSIGKVGLLQPILVRPVPAKARFELVCGERRWRAAKAARLTRIPAVVRELSELEVLEIQVAENLQRVDLPPLEEAAGYQALHDRHGYSVEEIADRVGKSQSYIRQRITLTKLHASAQEYLQKGLLTPSTAILVARLPSPTDQEAAAKAIIAGPTGAPLSLHQARDLIRDRFMRALSEAPFPTDDATLAPAAGACITCPKRSAAQPQLFGDITDKDRCLDQLCWDGKRELHRVRRLETHQGPVVRQADYMEPDDAPDDWEPKAEHAWSAHWVRADDHCTYDKHATRTWREVIGDRLPVTLIEKPDSDLVEVYPRLQAVEVLQTLGIVDPPRASGDNSEPQDRVRTGQRLEPDPWPREAWGEVIEGVVANVERIDGRLLLVGLLQDYADNIELPDSALELLNIDIERDEKVVPAIEKADAMTLTRVALRVLLGKIDEMSPWEQPYYPRRAWLVQLADAMQVPVPDEVRAFAEPEPEEQEGEDDGGTEE